MVAMKMTLDSLGLLGQKIEANFDAIVRRSVNESEQNMESGKLATYVNLRQQLLDEVERYLDYELDPSTIHFEDK
jgi:hypothetical protein